MRFKYIIYTTLCIFLSLCLKAQPDSIVIIKNSEYNILFPFDYDSSVVLDESYNAKDSISKGCFAFFKEHHGSQIIVFLKYNHIQSKKSLYEWLDELRLIANERLDSIQEFPRSRNIYDSCCQDIESIQPNWFYPFKMIRDSTNTNNMYNTYLVMINQNYLYTCNSICSEYHRCSYSLNQFDCEVLISIRNVFDKKEEWIDDLIKSIQIVRK